MCWAWSGNVAGTEEVVSGKADPYKNAAARIFLSHAGIDTVAAHQLKERILAAPDAEGIEVWFDKDDLDAGRAVAAPACGRHRSLHRLRCLRRLARRGELG